eukprot:734552-Hanusia_phi.AAC.1
MPQATYGNLTFAVIGAPGANLAFVIALRQFPYTCEVRNTLSQYSGIAFTGYQFGYSVAINSQSIFVGVPYYAYRGESGILSVFTYCSPGNAIGTYTTCTPCPPGQTSDGGVSQCVSCNINLPQHATCIGSGCNPTCLCDAGYFGTQCLPCSQYAPAAGLQKPSHSSWVDMQTSCTWRCNDGFNKSNHTCINCSNMQMFNSLSNVEWIPGTCSWQCKATFFSLNYSQSDLNCTLCSIYKAATGEQLPPNTRWLDHFNECKYVPLPGFSCESQGNCS